MECSPIRGSNRLPGVIADPGELDCWSNRAVDELPALTYNFPERSDRGERVAATENVTVLFTDLVSSTSCPRALHRGRRRTAAGSFLYPPASHRLLGRDRGQDPRGRGHGRVPHSFCRPVLCRVHAANGRSGQHEGGTKVGTSRGPQCGRGDTRADDYFGDPVIEAARLCAHASGGQILVADLVRAMAGRRCRTRSFHSASSN